MHLTKLQQTRIDAITLMTMPPMTDNYHKTLHELTNEERFEISHFFNTQEYSFLGTQVHFMVLSGYLPYENSYKDADVYKAATFDKFLEVTHLQVCPIGQYSVDIRRAALFIRSTKQPVHINSKGYIILAKKVNFTEDFTSGKLGNPYKDVKCQSSIFKGSLEIQITGTVHRRLGG